MAIEVTKKPNESINNFLLRFNRALKQAGILDEARKKRFFESDVNRNRKRQSAVYRAQIKEKVTALKKRGILTGKEDLKLIKKLLRNPKRSFTNLPK